MPWIFINVLCFIDRTLTESLKRSIICGHLSKLSKTKRSFYNYLLIDANKFSSMMMRCSGLSLGENETNFHDFKLFKSCIFYIGKGTNGRRDAHLKCAKKVHLGQLSIKEVNGQIVAICKCWENNGGVMNIQIEAEATTYEAHCREAAIISALGLINLKNKISGAKYGDMKLWSDVKLNNYGEMTLFIAFKNFILKRPPVIKANDVYLCTVASRCKKSITCDNCGHVNK